MLKNLIRSLAVGSLVLGLVPAISSAAQAQETCSAQNYPHWDDNYANKFVWGTCGYSSLQGKWLVNGQNWYTSNNRYGNGYYVQSVWPPNPDTDTLLGYGTCSNISGSTCSKTWKYRP